MEVLTYMYMYSTVYVTLNQKACSITQQVGRFLNSVQNILVLYFSLPFLHVECFVSLKYGHYYKNSEGEFASLHMPMMMTFLLVYVY